MKCHIATTSLKRLREVYGIAFLIRLQILLDCNVLLDLEKSSPDEAECLEFDRNQAW
jgi:hypothetical protein